MDAVSFYTEESELHPIPRVERVKVRRGLHLVYNDSCVGGEEVKAVLVGDTVAVHEGLKIPACIACAPAENASTGSKFIVVQRDEQSRGNIAIEPALLASFAYSDPVMGVCKAARAD